MLPDFSFCGDKMNSRAKLSAKAALCGSYAKIIGVLVPLAAAFVIFSFANAIINKYFSHTGNGFLVSAAIVTLPLAIFAIAPLCLLMQVRLVYLARGIRYCEGGQITLSEGLKACDLCVRLFAVKIFWLAVFEALPVCSMLLFFFQIKSVTVSLKAAYTVAGGLFILAAAGLIFWLIFIQRYSKSMFFLACYRDFTAADAMRESVIRTKNTAADIFLFKLGFVPWFVLCLLVFPALYVIPYYKQSVTCLFLGR